MIQPRIVIVDYGAGNIGSVRNALNVLNYTNVKLCSDRHIIESSDAIILPGVGAFSECVSNLKSRNLDLILEEVVLNKSKPLLGICVGMQLLADYSEEGGIHEGLGWIPGAVTRLCPDDNLVVPHVGWNSIKIRKNSPLFVLHSEEPDFYFDHSYNFACSEDYKLAQSTYGCNITAAVNKGNIFGVQFHPEKSHRNGLKLFRSFLTYLTEC